MEAFVNFKCRECKYQWKIPFNPEEMKMQCPSCSGRHVSLVNVGKVDLVGSQTKFKRKLLFR